MACYYYIKLSDGGNIKIPAISSISKTNTKLLSLISNYYERGNEQIIYYLQNELKVPVENEIIKQLLLKSNAGSFIDVLNTTLQDSDKRLPLTDLLWRGIFQNTTNFTYTSPKGVESEINLESFIEKISEPIDETYLKNVEKLGLVGLQSPESKIVELENTIDNYINSGIVSKLDSAMHEIINNVFINSTENILYKLSFSPDTNDSIVILPKDSKSPIIFFNESSNISLFLGILKYLGLTSSRQDIERILLEEKIEFPNNWTIQDFFIGAFNEDGVYKKELFTDLLESKNKKALERVIKTIFKTNETTYNWTPSLTNDLINSSLFLSNFLNPEKYSKSPFLEEDNASIYYNKFKEERHSLILEQLQSTLLGKTGYKTNNYYYAPAETKTFSKEEDLDFQISAYNYIINNLAMKRDLIMFPKAGDFGKYAVITNVSLNNRGLNVEGYIESDGIFKVFNQSFRGDSIEIRHRSLENLSTHQELGPAQIISKTDSIIISSGDNEFIDSDFAKRTLVRGASVEVSSRNNPEKTYKYIVKAVHPGKVEVNAKTTTLLNYDTIKTIRTLRWDFIDEEFTEDYLNRSNELKKYRQLKDNDGVKYIAPNDIVVYSYKDSTRISRVVKTAPNAIYVLIKYGDKYLITAIAPEHIDRVFKKNKEVSISNNIKVATFDQILRDDRSISDSEFSFFNNPEVSKNGDYVILEEGDSKNIYQIVDKKNGILEEIAFNEGKHEYTNKYTQLSKEAFSKLNRFITKRDISSSFVRPVIEMNSWEILLKKPKEEHKEIVFLVKKDQRVDNLVTLRSGIINKGLKGDKYHFYNEAGIPNNNFPKTHVDITNAVMKRLSKERGEDAEGLFVRTTGEFFWRFNRNYYRISEMDKFSDEQKESILQTDAFITLYKNNNTNKLENKTYRIANKTEDFITLEYSTFSTEGKILSILKTLPKKEVLDRAGIYYLMNGNTKIPLVKKYQQSVLEKSAPTTTRKQLFARIAHQFSTILNIPTSISENGPEKNDKKAWLEIDNAGVKIVLNLSNTNVGTQDFIHEYLHLFFIALKYTPQGATRYENLMLSYKKNELIKSNDWSEIEESFVRKISQFMAGNSDEPIVDFNSFVDSLNGAISNLGLSKIYLGSNIFEVLNNDMSKIFNKNYNNGLENSGLVLFEANFREWFSDMVNDSANFEINCG